MTMSQIVELEKPMRAYGAPGSLFGAVSGTSPVSTPATMPMMVTAPIGMGLRMIPTIVAANRPNMRHAWSVSASGCGPNQNARVIRTGMPKPTAIFFQCSPPGASTWVGAFGSSIRCCAELGALMLRIPS